MPVKEMLKIVVLSGGSGNDALVKGLKTLFGKEQKIDVKVIVNAYDNGKSTGVCRAVTDTLGVSDIRKNHERMYEIVHEADDQMSDFFVRRFDFTKGKEADEISALLEKWGMPQYIHYVRNFFTLPAAADYEYKDFVVANIVYAQMYRELGYEKTNRHFCEMMGIEDFVVLNSFDNVFIKAVTESGDVIEDEGEMVCWNNPDNKITDVFFDVRDGGFGLNPEAISLVRSADLILISTGTFWSSLQPTVKYLDFYKYINASSAKKIWILNNLEDGDSYGVSSLEFVQYMERTGLDLSEFDILVNADAHPLLRMTDDKHNFQIRRMGNVNGKHNPELFARAVLDVYFGLDEKFDKIILDFDDTLWSRNGDAYLTEMSKDNLRLLNDKFADKAVIISGNAFDGIREKIAAVYGQNLGGFVVPIWADANSTLYVGGDKVRRIAECVLAASAIKRVMSAVRQLGVADKTKCVGSDGTVNIKIKPLAGAERDSICNALNSLKGNFVAYKTGKTTVDVLSRVNNKRLTLDYMGHCGKTLYIGDEIACGNDSEIAARCTASCQIKSVVETNILLRLLEGRYI